MKRVGLVSLGVGLAVAGAGAAVGLSDRRHSGDAPATADGDTLTSPRVPSPRSAARPTSRADNRPGRRAPAAPEPALGSVRSRRRVVRTDDGVTLHAEIDEADADAAAGPTVVFTHGYSLNLDCWHYQRLALRGRYRMVFWDQRGHGRSESGPRGSSSVDRCGEDLQAVIDTLVPDGPIVLVGHSMGGMTVMALAAQRPDLFAERVVGAALISTSSGGLSDLDFGLRGVGRVLRRWAPSTLAVLSLQPDVVERGRRLGRELEQVVVRRYSFASDVSPEVVRFAARMIAETPLPTVSDYLPALGAHDKAEALAALDGLELLVLVGDDDHLTPPAHSEVIVQALPGAEHVVVRDGGHLVMLEHPDLVDAHLIAMLDRAGRGRGAA